MASYNCTRFVFGALLFVSNSLLEAYAEAARVTAFAWLLFQGLVLVDGAHDAHEWALAGRPPRSSSSTAGNDDEAQQSTRGATARGGGGGVAAVASFRVVAEREREGRLTA